MSSRLSSLLVQDGLCTAKRVADAFQRQVIYGGTLDSNLLELKAVEEDDLIHYLGRADGMPTQPTGLAGAGTPLPEVLEVYTKEVAERFHAVPTKLLPGGILRVLVPDGVEITDFDELALRVQQRIEPWITLEFRFIEALDLVYGTGVPTRYARLLSRSIQAHQGRGWPPARPIDPLPRFGSPAQLRLNPAPPAAPVVVAVPALPIAVVAIDEPTTLMVAPPGIGENTASLQIAAAIAENQRTAAEAVPPASLSGEITTNLIVPDASRASDTTTTMAVPPVAAGSETTANLAVPVLPGSETTVNLVVPVAAESTINLEVPVFIESTGNLAVPVLEAEPDKRPPVAEVTASIPAPPTPPPAVVIPELFPTVIVDPNNFSLSGPNKIAPAATAATAPTKAPEPGTTLESLTLADWMSADDWLSVADKVDSLGSARSPAPSGAPEAAKPAVAPTGEPAAAAGLATAPAKPDVKVDVRPGVPAEPPVSTVASAADSRPAAEKSAAAIPVPKESPVVAAPVHTTPAETPPVKPVSEPKPPVATPPARPVTPPPAVETSGRGKRNKRGKDGKQQAKQVSPPPPPPQDRRPQAPTPAPVVAQPTPPPVVATPAKPTPAPVQTPPPPTAEKQAAQPAVTPAVSQSKPAVAQPVTQPTAVKPAVTQPAVRSDSKPNIQPAVTQPVRSDSKPGIQPAVTQPVRSDSKPGIQPAVAQPVRSDSKPNIQPAVAQPVRSDSKPGTQPAAKSGPVPALSAAKPTGLAEPPPPAAPPPSEPKSADPVPKPEIAAAHAAAPTATAPREVRSPDPVPEPVDSGRLGEPILDRNRPTPKPAPEQAAPAAPATAKSSESPLPPLGPPPRVATALDAGGSSPISLEAARELADTVEDRDSVFEALCRGARSRGTFAAVLTLHGEVAFGRVALQDDWLDRSELGRIAIPLDRSSPFRGAAKERTSFLGKIGTEPTSSDPLRAMRRSVPTWAAVLPVLVRGRTVALLYIDDDGRELPSNIGDELKPLLADVGQAFARLLQQNKAGGLGGELDAGVVSAELPATGTSAFRSPSVKSPPAASPASAPSDSQLTPLPPNVPAAVSPVPQIVPEQATVPLRVSPPKPATAPAPAPARAAVPESIHAQPTVPVSTAAKVVAVVASEVTAPISTKPTVATKNDKRPGQTEAPIAAPAAKPAAVKSGLAGLVERAANLDETAIDQLVTGGSEAAQAVVAALPGPLRNRQRQALGDEVGGPVFNRGPLLALVLRLGQAAIEPMLTRLADPTTSAETRYYLALCLAEAPVLAAVLPLGERLFDEDDAVRMAAVTALRNFPPSSELTSVVGKLRDALDGKDDKRVRFAVEALGELRVVQAVPQLINLIDHEDPALVDAIGRALQTITKQDFGRSQVRWTSWWRRRQDEPRLQWLLEGLTHPSAMLRSAAQDELTSLSGDVVGYRFDQPRRDREQARQRWAQWWQRRGYPVV